LRSHDATLQRDEVMMYIKEMNAKMTTGYNLEMWVQQCSACDVSIHADKQKMT